LGVEGKRAGEGTSVIKDALGNEGHRGRLRNTSTQPKRRTSNQQHEERLMKEPISRKLEHHDLPHHGNDFAPDYTLISGFVN
jgi:hypothetical protein